jgi:hypothetical protein
MADARSSLYLPFSPLIYFQEMEGSVQTLYTCQQKKSK